MAFEIPLAPAITLFLKRYEMSPVTFGRKALNDPHFVRDIGKPEKPRRVWPETEAKVRAFMRDHEAAARRALEQERVG